MDLDEVASDIRRCGQERKVKLLSEQDCRPRIQGIDGVETSPLKRRIDQRPDGEPLVNGRECKSDFNRCPRRVSLVSHRQESPDRHRRPIQGQDLHIGGDGAFQHTGHRQNAASVADDATRHQCCEVERARPQTPSGSSAPGRLQTRQGTYALRFVSAHSEGTAVPTNPRPLLARAAARPRHHPDLSDSGPRPDYTNLVEDRQRLSLKRKARSAMGG